MSRIELKPCRWFKIERHGNRGNYYYYAIYYGEVKIESKNLSSLRQYINGLSMDEGYRICHTCSHNVISV